MPPCLVVLSTRSSLVLLRDKSLSSTPEWCGDLLREEEDDGVAAPVDFILPTQLIFTEPPPIENY